MNCVHMYTKNYVQNVQSSISHNSPKLQTTQMLINGTMNKHTVVYSHNSISHDKLHLHAITSEFYKHHVGWGTWVAPTSAQVVISQFVGSSPALGAVLTVQSLEPPSDFVSPSLSAPAPLMLCLSLKSKHSKNPRFPVDYNVQPELT